MCGIGGIWERSGRQAEHDQLRRVMSAIGHRGPEGAAFARNDQGALILGFLQLGFTDGGACLQPMHDGTQQLTLVYNGEIYDHPALRTELQQRGHLFETASDTEVVLRLYQEYGDRLFEHLNGEFAFAIWDGRKNELVLARDRFGVKPLFYAWHRGAIVFASEAKGILALEGFPAELNPAYFTGPGVGLAECTLTPFLGISSVRPGHVLRVSRQQLRQESYWEPKFGQRHDLPLDEGASAVRETLTRAVQRRLAGNPPIALSLSSGLDSSIVCGLMAAHAGRKLTAFSVGYDGAEYDESAAAEKTAAHFGVGFERVTCTPQSLAEKFLESAYAIEVPTNSLSATARIQLTAAVRAAGHKALMSGEGSDELFGGYPYFGLEAIWRMKNGQGALRKFNATEAASRGIFWDDSQDFRKTAPLYGYPSAYHLRVLRTQRDSKRLFSRDWQLRMGATALSTALSEFPVDRLKSLAPFDATRLIARGVLASIVIPGMGDRVEMTNSLEGRVPFLDRNLVELAYSLPEALCIDPVTQRRKHVLRRAFEGLLPSGLQSPAKTTLMAPSWADFRRTATGRDLIERLLSDRAIKQAGVFNPFFARTLRSAWRVWPEGGRRHAQLDLLVGYLLSTQALHHVLDEDGLSKRGAPRLALDDDRTAGAASMRASA